MVWQYYLDKYNQFYDKCMEQAKESGASFVELAAAEIFEETAKAEHVAGYYLLTHKGDAYKCWRENLYLFVKGGGVLSEQDEEVSRILEQFKPFRAEDDLSYSVELFPVTCNLCGGKVVFTSNSKIYGREYGSGKMYYCTQCGAFVGTHKPRPQEALGLLADAQMRDMKKKCHELFDKKWLNKKDKRKARKNAYSELASELAISINQCHFGYFDLEMLQKAYEILSSKCPGKVE